MIFYQHAHTASTQLPDDLVDIHGRGRGDTGKWPAQQAHHLSTVDSL
jgi:hypothetical protein